MNNQIDLPGRTLGDKISDWGTSIQDQHFCVQRKYIHDDLCFIYRKLMDYIRCNIQMSRHSAELRFSLSSYSRINQILSEILKKNKIK